MRVRIYRRHIGSRSRVQLSETADSIEHVNDATETVSTHPAVVALQQAMDGLLEVDLDGLSQDGLLGLMRDLETERRRLPAVDHALIGELLVRNGGRGCPGSAPETNF